MFKDAFPATRNAIRRLEQIRAGQESRPAANEDPGHDLPPVQPDQPQSGASSAKVSDLVIRLSGLPASARIEIAITIGTSDATKGGVQ
ncbi:MAG: hypothetical protein ABS35_12810 [Kaistia sp. SCN 65-12]|mgnify:CR=1 FL=1|nr:MAG: hypothetical protein ABS35_12810 [Kaistia sp. SCN 65-12]